MKLKPLSLKAQRALDPNIIIRAANLSTLPTGYSMELVHFAFANELYTIGVKITHTGSRLGFGVSPDITTALKIAISNAICLFGNIPETYLSSSKVFITDDELFSNGRNSLSVDNIGILADWKKLLNIKDDFELDRYVGEWGAKVLNTPGMTLVDLTSSNFIGFTKFLDANYNTGSKK